MATQEAQLLMLHDRLAAANAYSVGSADSMSELSEIDSVCCHPPESPTVSLEKRICCRERTKPRLTWNWSMLVMEKFWF